jgi:predicted Zn-dependent protease
VNHYYSSYAPRPADLPSVDTVRKSLNVAGTELMAMREASTAPDYTGPVLFEARAAAPLIAEVLGPSLSGARQPLAFQPVVDQLMSSLGANSEWSGKVGSRVLPLSVSLVDDPFAKDFKGAPLVGSYSIDEEGVPAEKVDLVQQGMLKNLLMSRRPGPDFDKSNGHGRSAFLADPKSTMSNLFFTSTQTVSRDDLKKKFLDACRSEKLNYCMVIRQMDNPSISLLHQEDFTELLASFGGNAATDRLPLVV